MATTNYGRYSALTAASTYQTLNAVNQSLAYRVYGTFSATVVIQIKRPDQAATEFSTIRSLTAADSGIIDLIGTWDVRIGPSDYTSGTVEIETS